MRCPNVVNGKMNLLARGKGMQRGKLIKGCFSNFFSLFPVGVCGFSPWIFQGIPKLKKKYEGLTRPDIPFLRYSINLGVSTGELLGILTAIKHGKYHFRLKIKGKEERGLNYCQD